MSDQPEKLLTAAMLRTFVPVHNVTIWRWIKQGTFPAPIYFNSRRYWRLSDVQAWIRARQQAEPSAQPTA